MFYSEPTEEEKKKDQNNLPFAIGALALFVCAMVNQKLASIENFYFQNFETIWLGVYAFVSIALLGMAFWIVKRTTALTDRDRLLSQLEEMPGKISVGTTTDGEKLHLSEQQRCGHTQILGSRGFTQCVPVGHASRPKLG